LSSSFLAKRAAAAEPSPQDPAPLEHLHDGLHISFTGASAFTSFAEASAKGRLSASGYGPGETLLVGGTPWRGVIVGGGLHQSTTLGNFADGSRVSADTATAGPFVEFYPDPSSGWHFGALAAAGIVRLRTPEASETSGVLGVMAIAGYEWWISPEWSLGINTTVGASTEPPLDAPSEGARYRMEPLSAGLEVGFTYH
jgi:hypothetical protein